jgi:hypothetical protein
MSEEMTYEYAEVIVGFFNRGEGTPVMTFMHVREINGDNVTPDFLLGPLEALNLMGAQGWQLLSERQPAHGRMQWVWGALKRHDERIDPDKYEATEFLMMRQVRD